MNALTLWFHKLGSPPYFYRFAWPWMIGSYVFAALFGIVGLAFAFVGSPADYLQGESVRIMYIHVPSAWMSMFIYFFVAANGFIALVWRIKLSEILAMCAAPIGAMFTAATLITGSLWGRPTWGTYWVWDARLTSELVLLFLYFGVIGLYQANEDPRKGARAASLLALVGIVNLPIIHYSVKWWNTLHQGESISLLGGKSSIDSSMLIPLVLMAIATKLYFVGSLMSRARVAVLRQESGKQWVRDIVEGNAASPAADDVTPADAPERAL
jgi:heme exporter protein C